ncbi:MAG: tetratricopeptide repeat protein [Gammaproteobacteria bacterium]|nr:tetratricopeptide repeat protein [Gammaproteobacteria bacterium]
MLDVIPDQVEALNFLALHALGLGRVARALELLEQANRHHPKDLATQMNLGFARQAAGDLEGARAAFQHAVEQDPQRPVVRLHLGHALEKLNRGPEALLAYFRAIADAQKQGHWLNASTTAPALLDRVRHAVRFAQASRRCLFEAVLEPVAERHGAAALGRVRETLATYLGDRPEVPVDLRQKPSILFFPGVPTTPYFARELFPWLEEFERQTAAIRDELHEVLPHADGRERVFTSDTEEQAGLRASHGAPGWDGFYFYRYGTRRDENHRRCPYTAAALAALPLMHVREHAPEVMFSVLTPGTHILPHRGVTNTRLVCHLPLIVPENCALVVGGETHHWIEGRGVVFDDTFEHEAWNRGTRTRVVLIADVWNPHLTPAERDAVAVLVGAIGDFHRAAAA